MKPLTVGKCVFFTTCLSLVEEIRSQDEEEDEVAEVRPEVYWDTQCMVNRFGF